jgi:A/G-specific adenine glycosylase
MAIVTRSGPASKQKAPATTRALRFRRTLLAWYGRHRRELPWRGVRDPYAVLVSEVMLQQTQVRRVREFFPRFLARYPTCEALATASPDAVRETWEGLGYYARARNLQRSAQSIMRDWNGRVPARPDQLRRLPGIGRYTAGAVASLAYGAPVAAVDTNAARVLTRVFGLRHRKPARVWALAESLVPPRRSSDWNQALMDLGALFCTARTPRCPKCPVRRACALAERRRVAATPATCRR